jgi:hypothetical protein
MRPTVENTTIDYCVASLNFHIYYKSLIKLKDATFGVF